MNETIRDLIDRLNNSEKNEAIEIPYAILGKVLEGSDYAHFDIWCSNEPGFFMVAIATK